jgi:type I restriction enzyme M protein
MTQDINFMTRLQTYWQLKSVCASYGLGNDGNNLKLLPSIFYKFLNDGFAMQWNKKNQN